MEEGEDGANEDSADVHPFLENADEPGIAKRENNLAKSGYCSGSTASALRLHKGRPSLRVGLYLLPPDGRTSLGKQVLWFKKDPVPSRHLIVYTVFDVLMINLPGLFP